MKTYRQGLVLLLILIITSILMAQNENAGEQNQFKILPDGKITVGEQIFNNYSEYFQSDYFKRTGKRCLVKWRNQENRTAALLRTSDCSLSRTLIKNEYWPQQTWVIPVVVHNITDKYNNGYLSDQRINDQIAVLNEDYRALTGTMGELGFDTNIQFELAGINRVKNDNWFEDRDEEGYKSALGWDQNLYLNIYTNTASGYLGYSYLPQEDAGDIWDGVVMLYESIGGRNNGYDVYDQGRTLVHEIGHYLGLLHTFEGESCYTGYTEGDLIDDTFPEDREHYGCTETNTCGDPDNIHNYMNYTDDICMSEFTPEQGNRMVCSLFNFRPQLAHIANEAPQITSTPVTECPAEQLYTYQVETADAENDTITFSLTESPAGMTINAVTGLLSWTPRLADTGQHNVTIKAADRYGEDIQSFILTVINTTPAPVAMFIADTTSGVIPLTVNFTDLSTGDITAWLWDFGDLTSSSIQNPQHIYINSGEYSVTLVVSGSGGQDSLIQNNYIQALPVPPQADFAADILSGPIPLVVQFADSSTGEISNWLWNFGDDSTSVEQNPLHVFYEPGEYSVQLKVTGPSGSDSLTKENYIHVVEGTVIASFDALPRSGVAPLQVQFTNSSTGDITQWVWNFGDSSNSDEQNPLHEFRNAGLYSVSLIASGPTDSDTLTMIDYITVFDTTPVAEYSAEPRSGVWPLQVQFADLSTGIVENWLWDFGDSTYSTEHNPVHEYQQPGLFSTSLIVTGPGGADTLKKVDYIQVLEHSPLAYFAGEPLSGRAPLTVQFADSSSGIITSWLWDFGDSTTSTNKNPQHEYMSVGLYTVTLQVTGPGGVNSFSRPNYIDVQTPLDIAQAKQLPDKFALRQNYPNPFNLTTTINYQLPERTDVWLAIYDMNGKIARILENNSKPAGDYQVLWDGKDANGQIAASGIYLVQLKCEAAMDNIKIILLK